MYGLSDPLPCYLCEEPVADGQSRLCDACCEALDPDGSLEVDPFKCWICNGETLWRNIYCEDCALNEFHEQKENLEAIYANS